MVAAAPAAAAAAAAAPAAAAALAACVDVDSSELSHRVLGSAFYGAARPRSRLLHLLLDLALAFHNKSLLNQ